jgi:hypothetical protein
MKRYEQPDSPHHAPASTKAPERRLAALVGVDGRTFRSQHQEDTSFPHDLLPQVVWGFHRRFDKRPDRAGVPLEGSLRLLRRQVDHLGTGKEIAKFTSFTDRVTGVCFSPDGKDLAACSNDNSAALFDLAGKKEKFKLNKHTGQVRAVAFSPDGKTLAHHLAGPDEVHQRFRDLPEAVTNTRLLGELCRAHHPPVPTIIRCSPAPLPMPLTPQFR